VNSDLARLRKIVSHSLSGKGAHVPTYTVFQGLNWKQAGTQPPGARHTVFQLLEHICFWQDWVLQWLDGKKPPLPSHASASWPAAAGPASAPDWKRAVQNFQSGLRRLERHSRTAGLAARPGQKSPLEMLQTIASHNSYHAGQVVAVRQLLGSWPPPSGGLTW
jgi:uncharacterized damage-inducible protein DinB